MTDYARVVGNTVVELFTPPDGVSIADCFSFEIAAQFAAIPNGVDVAPGWTYGGSSFAAPSPPVLTAEQILGNKIADGIDITCTGDPTISAVYALDVDTMNQVGAVARDAASGLGLPGDAATFTYPDLLGAPHAFTAVQFIALYKAMRDLLLVLNTQSALMKNGFPPDWPTQTATIA